MDRKQLVLQAKEMYPELFAKMEDELKELVQPIESGDKAHTIHEKIMLKLEQDLKDAQVVADWRGELLRRCKYIMDVNKVNWNDMTERFDSTVFDELTKELGDG